MVVNNNPWFKAKEVATIIGYANTKQAIITNVESDDKQTYYKILETLQVGGQSARPVEYNEKHAIYINEPIL
ncbi:MAG: Bro-N domain-containing protein [Candidatus Fonsibacter sp.]